MEKSSEVYRKNNNGPKTLPCGTPDMTLTSLHLQPSTITYCDRFDELCQCRQHRNSYVHRTELTQNSLMVDPIKGCTEINLYDPSLMPTLQCTLQCMQHTQKCITGTLTFPMSKLGGWKHTTAYQIQLTRRYPPPYTRQ